MAASEFILQGFTASTHINALQQLFDLPDIQKVLVGVAFVTEDGVKRIEAQLIPHGACTTVFAGIRNDITSYQGLTRLHGIVGQLYTVDTGSRTVVFHPKLYLARGIERARLVIGSANLTLAGLNNNIEAGMLIEFDLASAGDKAMVDNIENLFATSVTDYPNNVVKVRNVVNLDKLLAADRLVDEDKILSHQDVSDQVDATDDRSGDRKNDSCGDSDRVPRIKLKVKALQNEVGVAKVVRNEFDRNEASELRPEAVGPSIPPSPAQFEPEDAATLPAGYFRRRRRERDGPRLRARRAKMEAISRGEKWYFTGEPCIYGHISDRLVSNGKCRECNRQDCERTNRLGLYR